MNSTGRDLIVVSGYYGYGNLGDEAILEVLIEALKKRISGDKIVVLSHSPDETARMYGVRSHRRFDLFGIAALMKRARLFISGGGGLYQDASSSRSVLYYAGLAHLASLSGAKQTVFAQGLGPLASAVSVKLTRSALKLAEPTGITLRDADSVALARSWGIDARLTADPVWCLEPASPNSPLVETLTESDGASSSHSQSTVIALSLRPASGFGADEAVCLGRALLASTGADARLLPLVLQEEQDRALTEAVLALWRADGRAVVDYDPESLVRPSHWLSLIAGADFMVAMRFHALLMALKAGKPCFGLSYDPKVSYLMRQFEAPAVELSGGLGSEPELAKRLISAISCRESLASIAVAKSRESAALACQNFELLDRIIG